METNNRPLSKETTDIQSLYRRTKKIVYSCKDVRPAESRVTFLFYFVKFYNSLQIFKLRLLALIEYLNIQAIHKIMVRLQKLTRTVLLTLHGHNVHRQQQQLSKFLMRYQQFTSHAYCGTAGPVSKMASQPEKAFCVLRFEVSRSVITMQREFRARFRKDAIGRKRFSLCSVLSTQKAFSCCDAILETGPAAPQ